MCSNEGTKLLFSWSHKVSLFQWRICGERYLVVVHPVVFLKYRILRYRVACVIIAWLLTLLVSKGATGGGIKFNVGIFTAVLYSTCSAVSSYWGCWCRSGPGDGGKEREGETEEGGKLMEKRASPSIQIILLTLLLNYTFLWAPWIALWPLLLLISACWLVLHSTSSSSAELGKLPCIWG